MKSALEKFERSKSFC